MVHKNGETKNNILFKALDVNVIAKAIIKSIN